MIVALMLPPILAGTIWLFVPFVHLLTPRGSAANKAEFLRVVKEPYSTAIYGATDRCFVVGALASNYEAVLAKADSRGALDQHWKSKPSFSSVMGTQYEFWCEGKKLSHDRQASVFVFVDEDPPVIVHTEVVVWPIDLPLRGDP